MENVTPNFRSVNSVTWLIASAVVTIALSRDRCLAQSNSGAAATTPTSPASPAVYEAGDVYLPASRVYAFVGKTGFGHEHAVAGQIKQGRVQLDAARDAGGLVFDMTSFVADTAEARKFVGLQSASDASTQQQVTANMRGADVLDVARYPTASFVIKGISKLSQPGPRGLPQYQLAGDFSLHGVSRPIQVMANAEEQNGWIHLRGGFSMLQTQFGITPFSKAFGTLGVTDQLNVWGDLWISKQRQVAVRPTLPR
jgi:polyisoprenoid-binding protein YceI